MKMMSIKDLVLDLPEVYQPIYGHADLDVSVSRSCEDRLEKILEVYSAIESFLGRPLKVLDLGCAQGFFSLNLAKKGASIFGIDYLDKNIAVCTELANQNPELKAQFKVGRVEEVIADLRDNEFDLVLGLSVFHHIIHEKGIEQVQALLNELAMKSGALILELALQEEPLYWGPSQSNNPRTLIQQIPFVHMLAQYPTHLSGIARPLYFASNRYWALDGQAGLFSEWFSAPYESSINTHKDSRRYFFSDEYFIKQYYLDDHERGGVNLKEFKKEISFLKNSPANFKKATYITLGESEKEAWVVMNRLPGILLLDLLRTKVKIDHREILLNLLDQLVILEDAGQFHGDVRTWNILVNKGNEIFLIDYGSISSHKEDAVWPKNIFFAFLIFVCEMVIGDDIYPVRRASFVPESMPIEYQAWCQSLWSYPIEEWSFKLMRTLLVSKQGPTNAGQPKISESLTGDWMMAIEAALTTQIDWLQNEWSASRQKVDALSEEISKAKQEEVRLVGIIEVHKSEHRMAQEVFLEYKTQTKTSLDDAYANIAWLEGEKNKVSELLDAKTLELTQTKTSLDDAYANIAWLEGEKNKVSELLDAKTLELTQTKTSLDDAYANIAWLEGEKNKVSELLDAKTLELTQTKTSLDDAYANIAWLEGEKNKVSEFYTKILASTSWKITRPIRVAKRVLIKLLRVIRKVILFPFFVINYFLSKLFNKILIWLHKRPVLRYKCINFLNKFPSLKYKLKLILAKSNHSQLLSNQISLPKESPQHISDHKFQKISVEEPNVSSDIDAILLIIKGKLDKGISS